MNKPRRRKNKRLGVEKLDRFAQTTKKLMCFAGAWQFAGMIIQANQYTGANFLWPVFDALGPIQLSLTSFSAALLASEAVSVVVLIILWLFGFRLKNTTQAYMTAITILTAVACLIYIGYEWQQSLHPEYLDNYGTDVIMGCLGGFTHWLVMLIALSTTKPNTTD